MFFDGCGMPRSRELAGLGALGDDVVGILEPACKRGRDIAVGVERDRQRNRGRFKVDDWVWFYNNEHPHSRLDYMSPVEFREAGLPL